MLTGNELTVHHAKLDILHEAVVLNRREIFRLLLMHKSNIFHR